MTTKNFAVKNGLTVGNVTISAATGNIITGNANLGNLAIANFFSGDGGLLSNISATGGNANYAGYAGNVTGNAQPNITSLGTLTSVSVSGNANIGNIGSDGIVTVVGNITGGIFQQVD